MGPTAEPSTGETIPACEDFYEYVCGDWLAATDLPPGTDVLARADDEVRQSVDGILDALLTEASQSSRDGDVERIGAFYGACMEAERVDPEAENTLDAWFHDIDGARDTSSLERALFELHQHGFHAFFEYAGVPDPAVPTRHRGEFRQGRILLAAESDSEARAALQTSVADTLLRSGLTEARATNGAAAVVDLHASLANAALSWEDNEFPSAGTEHPHTARTLAEAAPGFDWAAYLRGAGADPTATFNVKSTEYLQRFAQSWSAATPRTRQLYMRWSLLRDLGSAAPPSMRPAPKRERADECMRALVRGLGIELSRQFSLRAVGPEGRARAVSIAHTVRDALAARVERATWMSAASRAATLEKLRATDLKVGYPEHWPATGDFPIDPHRHLDNVLAARAFETQRSWRRATQTRDRTSWEMKVRPNGAFGMGAARLVIPNGFPDPFSNSILLTAASLRPPMFDAEASIEANYATLGFLVGHELIHVVENYESDGDGIARRLWTDDDLAIHDQRAECLVEQANAFVAVGETHVNGMETREENGADLAGLRAAYEALEATLGNKTLRAESDGTTPEQRFFEAYARRWCTQATVEYRQMAAERDWHGPPNFRVNGVLSNFPEFGRAYACPDDAPMVRPEASVCGVW